MKSIYVSFGSKTGIGDTGSTVFGKDAKDIANQIYNDLEFGQEGYYQSLYPENDNELNLAKDIQNILKTITINTEFMKVEV